MVLTDEECKANQRKADDKYRFSEQGKTKIKEYRASEQGKASVQKYQQSGKGKASAKKAANKYKSSKKGKTKIKEYTASEQGKTNLKRALKKWRTSEQGKAKIKEYTASEQGKANRKKFYQSEKGSPALRLKVLQYYSKLHSNSEIPCCRCCGQNSHLDFLALDHIQGRYEMDSIPELVKIEYKSALDGRALNSWIIKNNYLKDLKTEYFQILCHNCNISKRYPRNKNKCMHEK